MKKTSPGSVIFSICFDSRKTASSMCAAILLLELWVVRKKSRVTVTSHRVRLQSEFVSRRYAPNIFAGRKHNYEANQVSILYEDVFKCVSLQNQVILT